jgi:hypothetical protein
MGWHRGQCPLHACAIGAAVAAAVLCSAAPRDGSERSHPPKKTQTCHITRTVIALKEGALSSRWTMLEFAQAEVRRSSSSAYYHDRKGQCPCLNHSVIELVLLTIVLDFQYNVINNHF